MRYLLSGSSHHSIELFIELFAADVVTDGTEHLNGTTVRL